MTTTGNDVDVVVVGAGQAGLGTGYWLAHNSSTSFVILDGAPRLGQSWTQRWDTLTLFTPRRFSALPGLRFPAGKSRYPTKDEMADYLQEYAARFNLPVRLGQGVETVDRVDGEFETRTADGLIQSRHVVVATGPFHSPHVPAVAGSLDPSVRQLHSSSYKTPNDIDAPDVLVVGGGNSAAQLACELSDTHQVTVASPGQFWFLPQTILGASLYWWLYLTGVLNAPTQARVSRWMRARGDAIIGRDLAHRVGSGHIRHLPHRVVDAHSNEVTLEDGTRVAVSAVLWCTGFRPDFGWLRVAGALDADGAPIHTAGASPVPGLHWIGLPWQTRVNSSLVNGIASDARTTVERATR